MKMYQRKFWVAALFCLFSAPAGALQEPIEFSADAGSAFERGLIQFLNIGQDGQTFGRPASLSISADGNGSVSIEVYTDAGELIGTGTAVMSNQGDQSLQSALSVTFTPLVGTSEFTCGQLGNQMECVITRGCEDLIFLRVIVSVRGRVERLEVDAPSGQGNITDVEGAGLAEIAYQVRISQSFDDACEGPL